ncbi:FMN-linked oxidoreductase [Cylindrobasidium torrendii FP15055 ss-10]|uniref:FMN-linked oxidoreductase n=1 Tax=Cylindrobasidium torrendii FP15055 ss-10 TaxID=1314674 RepID=A0A0D7AWR4_9AGAR|nr:FMN-linked oxidoreductase [Cylindrobasidium torrendii FP15055 ss-10]
MTSTPTLFTPIQVGKLRLSTRVVLAPMTRLRTNPVSAAPLIPLVATYYGQRASTPGTLLITESTIISEKAGGLPFCPGIYSDEQIAAWKEVVDAVHAKGSFIFLQLVVIGRQAMVMPGGPTPDIFSASAIPKDEKSPFPREATKEDLAELIEQYAVAAENAVFKAGFDGVEIHGANGFLLDCFTQDTSNHREDNYGGSIENRARFPLEVVDRVIKSIGADRVGYRVGPWAKNGYGMGMQDPKPQFAYLAQELKKRNIAFLHAIEARFDAMEDVPDAPLDANDFLREIWAPLPFIACGGYNRESGLKTAEEKGDIVAFGRWFLSNPDLPKRLEENKPFNAYDRHTFYTFGDATGKGYTDYSALEVVMG